MPNQHYSLTAEEGPAFWFINSLVTIKSSSETTGRSFSLAHQVAPPAFATPYHRHVDLDEAFYLLEGSVTFFCEGERIDLTAGGYIYLPGGVAHGFRVDNLAPATMLILCLPGNDFTRFVEEMGTPAIERTLPTPVQPDMQKLIALSVKYGSEILGPLPGSC